ncbi:potassium-transporting ATPase KdpC subunit [Paenibacillus baekrokdamisoli]|uniref:Potassium-transporting ATPase KdpC subunit n=1 Tax=Paenibacillus baekrokdamisoli TaxID=1712516 RepID=A0A3G9JG61_9BACL|nr:potassium-transporting ATPase subunit KdpC [Paenibacillus baekrokdamisoli]MBB3071527.1 K+-transporting ATPase ATPase C chain [Paenibacillus baekrokdamisoli]BBH21959.1 potassium-transporting ATPase KdpC subunit [Paenibacillus baekrokdamisoli]
MQHTISNSSGEANLRVPIVTVAIRASIVFILLCGVIYPLVSTGAAQLLFPFQADGSLIKDAKGNVVGSELIGQSFTDQSFFQGRISSIEYKAEASGTNNYGPSNPALLERVKASMEEWKKNNPDVPIDQVPIALLTNSGSGLDPDITPQSAIVQIPRISKLTGISADTLTKLVDTHTQGRSLGVFGDPRINVLKLNIALQALRQ